MTIVKVVEVAAGCEISYVYGDGTAGCTKVDSHIAKLVIAALEQGKREVRQQVRALSAVMGRV